ncbi:MAG: hypothetical protein V1735_05490 [Nanoarchaeota archaeon]
MEQDAVPAPKQSQTIYGTQELVLTGQDLQQLGMAGPGCRTEEGYTNIVDPSQGQYSFCNYTIARLNDTEVLIELQKFDNIEALNGTYQYQSLHYFSVEGLLSEDDFGDQSRFRVSNEHDYGGQFNDPDVSYYHLWITKDLFLIHITTQGSNGTREHVAAIGRRILSKFG